MTPCFASIEQLNEEEAHPTYDIWSAGIILYNLMAKNVPFPQIGVEKRMDAIRRN
jgi:serine/threonine protein kinase